MRTLLLNSSYAPIGTISTERAMILLIGEKVEMVEANKNLFIRTINKSYPIPEIVRLKRFVFIKKKDLMPTKHNIMVRDNHTCGYCGSKRDLTIDHILPSSKGGKDTWKNMVTCCFKCNNKKGDRTPEDAGMTLSIVPSKPTHLHVMRNYSYENGLDSWKDFLYLNN